ncbi:unnamed protein product [Withania somnifera]
MKTSSRKTCVFVLFACFSMCQLAKVVASECSKNMVIFNFGDSNSDTGGYPAAHGIRFGFPDGRTFFHQPSDRLCDGRLILDFLCSDDLVEKEDLKNALFMIDIGQNDLAGAFTYLSQASQVIQLIPSFISEIQDAILGIYNHGGKNFWIHNTGPLGCLPQKVATRNASNSNDLDDYGCIKSMNEAAKTFNNQLRALCEQLRLQMKDATIVYVDMYAIKYDLIANSGSYGIENPLMVCCGYGGPPYNYNSNITCRQSGFTLCKESSAYVSWDGIHYAEFGNAIIASKILSTNYSTPPLDLHHFCT